MVNHINPCIFNPSCKDTHIGMVMCWTCIVQKCWGEMWRPHLCWWTLGNLLVLLVGLLCQQAGSLLSQSTQLEQCSLACSQFYSLKITYYGLIITIFFNSRECFTLCWQSEVCGLSQNSVQTKLFRSLIHLSMIFNVKLWRIIYRQSSTISCT